MPTMTRSDGVYLGTVLDWPGLQMEDVGWWLDVIDLWVAEPRWSRTEAVIVRRALDGQRGVWSRRLPDLSEYLIPIIT